MIRIRCKTCYISRSVTHTLPATLRAYARLYINSLCKQRLKLLKSSSCSASISATMLCSYMNIIGSAFLIPLSFGAQGDEASWRVFLASSRVRHRNRSRRFSRRPKIHRPKWQKTNFVGNKHEHFLGRHHYYLRTKVAEWILLLRLLCLLLSMITTNIAIQ